MNAITNWSNLFVADADGVHEASTRIAKLSELRRTGAMLDVFGPFRSESEAEVAMRAEDPSDAGLSVEQIDWTGFYEVGGWQPG